MTLEKQLEKRGEERGEDKIITLLKSGKYSLEQIESMTIEERDEAYKDLLST